MMQQVMGYEACKHALRHQQASTGPPPEEPMGELVDHCLLAVKAL